MPGIFIFSSPLTMMSIRLWPQSPTELTPRASQQEKDPFNDLAPRFHSLPSPLTPTAVHPLLGKGSTSPFFPPNALPPAAYGTHSDLTLGTQSPGSTSAQPTTHLSLHAPVFNIMQPPLGKNTPQSSPAKPAVNGTPAGISSTATTAPPPPTGPASSKGQIHVKLIQARGLNVRSIHARPYVVVQFEQNEFVSRDPIAETDKEVKGTATSTTSAAISRQTSSNAINALGAIGNRAAAAAAAAAKRKGSGGSKDSSPSGSLISKAFGAHRDQNNGLGSSQPPTPTHGTPNANGGGLFGRLSAHNPVWKHEVSL